MLERLLTSTVSKADPSRILSKLTGGRLSFETPAAGLTGARGRAWLVDLTRGRDLLGNDAQYAAEELQKQRGWGHSSFNQAMQVAEMADVEQLALTHHDPEHDDEFLEHIEKLSPEAVPNEVIARAGMEIPI